MRLVVEIPLFTRVLYIPGGCLGFLLSTVVRVLFFRMLVWHPKNHHPHILSSRPPPPPPKKKTLHKLCVKIPNSSYNASDFHAFPPPQLVPIVRPLPFGTPGTTPRPQEAARGEDFSSQTRTSQCHEILANGHMPIQIPNHRAPNQQWKTISWMNPPPSKKNCDFGTANSLSAYMFTAICEKIYKCQLNAH